MNFEKINRLIKDNQDEIERLEKNSDNASKDRVAYLKEENTKLETFKANYTKQAEQLVKLEEEEKKDKNVKDRIKKLRNEMNSEVKKVEKLSQGKLRNVFSTMIGQVDKRIHNWWYREGKDNRWNEHTEKINERYKNIPKYILKNTGMSIAMFLGLGAVVALIPATSAVLTPVIFGTTATFITQTAIKAGVAIYNKRKFGGPLLERNKKILNGTYLENIENATYEKKASKNIFSRVKELSYKLIGKKSTSSPVVNSEKKEEDKEKTNEKVNEKENTLNLTDEVIKAIFKLNSITDINKASLEELTNVINETKRFDGKLPLDAQNKYNMIFARAQMLFDEKVKNAIEVIKNVNLETATLEDLHSVIEWTKDVSEDLPENYKEKYNKIFAKYQMLLDKKDNKKNNDDKRKPNNNRINKLIMDFNLNSNDINDYYNIIYLVGKHSDELDNKALKKYNDIYEKAQMLYEKQNKKTNVQKPNIDNYANLDQFNVVDINKDDKNLTFAKAISIVRDKSIHSQDEWEAAMNKLASVFGSGKNKKTSDTVKVLSDFNKTEKLIAEYGRKIREGNATGEDKLIHQALLYHLAKYDVIDNFSFDTVEEDINDFIADEAKRYSDDLKKFEENSRKTR